MTHPLLQDPRVQVALIVLLCLVLMYLIHLAWLWNEHELSWKRILCDFGIHWSGRSNGGGMGDAYSCDICGRDNYSPCFLVHDRSKE